MANTNAAPAATTPAPAAAPPTSTALDTKEKPKTKMEVLQASFNEWRPWLVKILPKHIEPERVVKIAMNAYLNNHDLGRCTPLSMVKATLQCAELGLDPSPLLGEAYFVPFKATVKYKDGNVQKQREEQQVKLMPGYVGLAKLAKQTGDVADVYAVPVFESEKTPEWNPEGTKLVAGFCVEEGTERRIHHMRNLSAARGELYAVYGVVKFKDGTCHFEVLSKADVEEHRKISQQAEGTAWKNHYVSMACKTAIRMAVKMVPKSPEKPLSKAVAVDNHAEFGEALRADFDSDVIDTTGETSEPAAAEQPATRTDQLAAAVAGKKAPTHNPETGELPLG